MSDGSNSAASWQRYLKASVAADVADARARAWERLAEPPLYAHCGFWWTPWPGIAVTLLALSVVLSLVAWRSRVAARAARQLALDEIDKLNPEGER